MVEGKQRFCPICDRVFVDGEAVLRCGNCELLHHPACWVKNGSCARECEGAAPEPIAYTVPGGRAAEPHPAEGTRVIGGAVPPPARGTEVPRDPVERVSRVSGDPAPPDDQRGDDAAAGTPPPAAGAAPIGRTSPNVGAVRETPPTVVEPPPRAQYGRYGGGGRTSPSVDDMKLYRRSGILRFWYVPVAALVAIAVAVGIVWGADEFMGGSDSPAGDDPEPTATAVAAGADATPTIAPTESAGASGDADGTPEATPGPTEAGDGTPRPSSLEPGVTAEVYGTGSCLRLREAAGTENEEIACVGDGELVTVVDGPQPAGDFTWWQVESDFGTGWAADAYLRISN